MFPFVILLSLLISLSFGYNPNLCWNNDDISEEPVSSACPLFPNKQDLKSSCVISLAPGGEPSNKVRRIEIPHRGHFPRCRKCVWKLEEEGMCQATKHWQRRDCCCDTPMCNRVVFQDALPGWQPKNSIPQHLENETNICTVASFQEGKWVTGENNKTVSYENCQKFEFRQKCGLLYTVSEDDNVEFMLLGCIRNSSFCKNADNLCAPNEAIGKNSKACCCFGRNCNEELYRRFGFDVMMNMRQKEQERYKEAMKNASKLVSKAKIWHKNEQYLKQKPIVDGCLIIGTFIYVGIVLSICRLYAPIDIDKRPRPIDASREKISSPSRE